jgi:putative two-component system response regulator
MEQASLIRILNQHRTYFIVLTLLCLFFLLVIVTGGRLIYNYEVKTLHENFESIFNDNIQTIKSFFSSSRDDMFFLLNIPDLKEYIDSGLESKDNKVHVRKTFYNFAVSQQKYYQIRLIDKNGNEIIRINNLKDGSTEIVPDGRLQNKKDRFYFKEIIGLDRGEIFVSSLDLNIENGKVEHPYVPVIRIGTPMFDTDGQLKGILVMNIYISKLFELLVKNSAIQNVQGYLLTLKPDGTFDYSRSPYDFYSEKGVLSLSDVEDMLYAQVEFLPGNNLILTNIESHYVLKKSLARLVIVSILILIVFFVFTLILIYIAINRLQELANAQKAIIFSLANLSERRDPETGSHLERTRNYTVLLARALQKKDGYGRLINKQFIEDIYDAAPLHDIGKVGIRDEILLKPTRLTEDEIREMREHVKIGRDVHQDIIDQFRMEKTFLTLSRNLSYYHHEKFDGTGYPEGLQGTDIPLEARIFAFCDVYDALRTTRPYKDGWPHDKVIEEMKSESGRQFDPIIVDTFLANAEEFDAIYETYRIFNEKYGQLFNVRSKDVLKIKWTPELSVNDERIDSQHKEVIDRINDLLSAIVRGESRKSFKKTVKFLKVYVLEHFRDEEEIMKRYEYPDYESHKKQHEHFIDTMAKFNAGLSTREITPSLIIRLNIDVVDWITRHIMNTDKKLGSFLGKVKS